MTDHTHQWQELRRSIPWQDADRDPHAVAPEIEFDQEGEPVEDQHDKVQLHRPEIVLQCTDPACRATRTVDIPDDVYAKLVQLLEAGELSVEDLSRLHLRDLVPGAEKYLADEGASGVPVGIALADTREG